MDRTERVSSRAVDLMMRTSTIGGHDVLAANGEIDLATIPTLHNALVRHAQSNRGGTVIVDLDGVTVCDDAGLGVLLGCAGRVRESGGDLVVVCSDGSLRQRLARTGFDRAIRVEPSVATVVIGAGAGASPTG